VVHNSMAPPAHWFDASQHERFRGKAFLDLQLGNLQAVPDVRQVAGPLEDLGDQVRVFQVAKPQLGQCLFQGQTRRQLADPVQLPGRLPDGLFPAHIGFALGQSSPNDARFELGELSGV